MLSPMTISDVLGFDDDALHGVWDDAELSALNDKYDTTEVTACP